MTRFINEAGHRFLRESMDLGILVDLPDNHNYFALDFDS